MSFSGRYLPAVLLASLTLTVSLFAQSTTKQTSKAPRGTVSGRVTIKEKGVAGVTLGMRKSDGANPFEPYLKATTDHDGFYRITNVPAGSYTLMPSAPAFVMADAKDTTNKIVIVGEDENVEGINFAMIRGGVITGRVTDADGRAVIEQRVNLYRTDALEQQSPERPVFLSSAAQTDDRGFYRMYGLSPGRYKVSVGRADNVFSTPLAPMRAIYKQVFHPDVTDQTKATVIEVSEASEANNVDIMLGRPLQTFAASGRVIDGEKGLPVPNMRFGLQRSAGQRTEFVNNPTVSNAQGDFIIEGLIPGKYTVLLFANQNNERRVETLSFDIIDQDVSNLTVRLVKGASLSGFIVLESEDKTAFEKLLQMQLQAFVFVKTGEPGGSSSSPIPRDGSFRLAGLPGGTANIQLGAAGSMPPKGFHITRLERDGVAVPPRGLEIKDGEQVTGLRVIVAHGNATLRGVVKLENGSLPPGARFFVRLTRISEPSSGLRPPPVDERGRFLVDGLPPGSYEVMVSIIGTGSGGLLPRAVRREVTLEDGVVTDVTIDLGTSPKP